MSNEPETPLPYKLEALIVSAFLAAQRAGKEDWRRMKIAVFKNRLLQMSKNKFSERNHGATSLREFLDKVAHQVTVEGDTVVLKEAAELIKEGTDAASASSPPPYSSVAVPLTPAVRQKERIRSDLWEATIDYSSGQKYAWDSKVGAARGFQQGDTLLLPTVSETEYHEWRTAFAGEQAGDSLARWVSGRGTMKELPIRLRSRWSSFLREKVEARLKEWFAKNGIEAPAIVEATTEFAPESTPDDGKALRRFVHNCVSELTFDELARLPLPAGVLFRMRRM